MTNWTNSSITKKDHNVLGQYREITYQITGDAGTTTGGTLTTPFKRIINCFVTACTASAVMASLTWRISTNTVIVAYTSAGAAHTVYITVQGR